MKMFTWAVEHRRGGPVDVPVLSRVGSPSSTQRFEFWKPDWHQCAQDARIPQQRDQPLTTLSRWHK